MLITVLFSAPALADSMDTFKESLEPEDKVHYRSKKLTVDNVSYYISEILTYWIDPGTGKLNPDGGLVWRFKYTMIERCKKISSYTWSTTQYYLTIDWNHNATPLYKLERVSQNRNDVCSCCGGKHRPGQFNSPEAKRNFIELVSKKLRDVAWTNNALYTQ